MQTMQKTQVQRSRTSFLFGVPSMQWEDVSLAGSWRVIQTDSECYMEFMAWGGEWIPERALRTVVTCTNECGRA